MIKQELLEKLYAKEGKSMQEIANKLGCSVHKVQYWMKQYNIKSRSISDAIYQWHNPDGDPFMFKKPRTSKEQMLYGLGLGLYWGEGTKASKHSVRLGNTDPDLIKIFMDFLIILYGVKRKDFRFGLQIFTDIDEEKALDFWTKKLRIPREQFGKVIVTKSGSIGTYRKKSQFGVVTLHYHNKKLRDLLLNQLAAVAQG
ncbi:helix-turn-helix domain-containing protein [Patescibacteria group bacterium]|nr:helix-turn-helix domain-containing protein [Patescibacteria group bacterium]MBU1123354.1 helix-turn-helix domain-containing protein [Patescibacteria group bacterium]MBU1911744.1 helix-turn-helix domain-containing protein [Patescibacteria group bacterium]